MWSKLGAIVWKDLYTTFRDRNLLLMMFAAPLAISVIVGSVFGGQSTGGFSIEAIPVAVVNQDEGTDLFGQPSNFGADFVAVVTGGEAGSNAGAEPVPAATTPCPLLDDTVGDGSAQFSGSLTDLFQVTLLEDSEAARTGVDDGTYTAAIIIPADFSAQMSPDIDVPGIAQSEADAAATQIEVYANAGRTISGSIVRSVVAGYVNTLLTGNITIGATISSLIDANPAVAMLAGNNAEANAVLGCGFIGGLGTVSLGGQSIANPQAEEDEPNLFALILVTTGAAQAVLFALFAAQGGIISVVEERRAGTLPRLLTTPTPRTVLIGGKFTATLVMVILQMSILLLALLVIASVNAGEIVWLWGTNPLALVGIVLATSLAVCGMGILIAGIARTPEQVGTLGTIINMALGVAGGAFGFAPPIPVAYFSLIYWGVDGLNKLGQGNVDIALNIAALLGQAALFFIVGIFLFNRRVEA